MSVTNKKTEHDSNQQDHQDNGDDEQVHISKRSKHENADNKQESELMIEPKNEYDEDEDDDEDGNVDLTMDDEMLEDLDQAGPSHGGEGSSQGKVFLFVEKSLKLTFVLLYMSGYHWQMDGRSQESQEAAGQHRDAQGKPQFSFFIFFFVCIFAKVNIKIFQWWHHCVARIKVSSLFWRFCQWFNIEFHTEFDD